MSSITMEPPGPPPDLPVGHPAEYGSVGVVHRLITSIVQILPIESVQVGELWASAAIESRGFPSWDLTQPSQLGLAPIFGGRLKAGLAGPTVRLGPTAAQVEPADGVVLDVRRVARSGGADEHDDVVGVGRPVKAAPDDRSVHRRDARGVEEHCHRGR